MFMPAFSPARPRWEEYYTNSGDITNYPQIGGGSYLALIVDSAVGTPSSFAYPTGATFITQAYHSAYDSKLGITYYYVTRLFYKLLSNSDSNTAIGGDGYTQIPFIFKYRGDTVDKISSLIGAGIDTTASSVSGTGTFGSSSQPCLAVFASLAIPPMNTAPPTHTFSGSTSQSFTSSTRNGSYRISYVAQNTTTSNVALASTTTNGFASRHKAFAFTG